MGSVPRAFLIAVSLILMANCTASALAEPREAPASRVTVELIRARGADTGVLNLATALWVAEASSDVYWLC